MADKLELVWPHKGEHVLQNPETGRWEFCGDAPLPFCPLIELETYGAETQKPFADENSNLLIRGDNLFALHALQRTHAGKVKLVYIDPPFNTGGDFDAYSDSFQHSVWLSMMHERLELIRNLLSDDGVLFVQLDDTEHGFLRALMDEVFGGMRRTRGGLWQSAFIANVVWQKAYAPRNNARHFSISHDNILVYAKDPEQCRVNLLPRTEEQDARYINPDNDPRGPWKPSDLLASLTSGQRGRQFQRTGRSPNLYTVTAPSGREISPPAGNCWRVSRERFEELDADGRIWWGESGNNVPALKRFRSEVQQGVIPQTIWLYEEVGHNQEARRELQRLFSDLPPFPTPKPERLMQRIIELGSNPGDIVLDCFAGSGTTGAVAHRLGRRWIMVEINGQAETLCKRRLQMEVDKTATTLEMGDGKFRNGFRYLEVGAPLLVQDPEAQLTILNPHYKNSKLVRVVCQLEGFALTGDDKYFHGRNGTQLAHVTEELVDDAYVRRLAKRLPDGYFLTIYSVKIQRNIQRPRNVSLKRLQTALVKPYLTKGAR